MYHSCGRNFHCADDCSGRNLADVDSLQHKFYDVQQKQEKLERALATARPLTKEFWTPKKEARHRKAPTVQFESPSFDLKFDKDKDADFPQQLSSGSGKANPPTQGAEIAAASLATVVALVAISSAASLKTPRPPIHIREPLRVPAYPEFPPNILLYSWDEYDEASSRFRGIYWALKYPASKTDISGLWLERWSAITRHIVWFRKNYTSQ